MKLNLIISELLKTSGIESEGFPGHFVLNKIFGFNPGPMFEIKLRVKLIGIQLAKLN